LTWLIQVLNGRILLSLLEYTFFYAHLLRQLHLPVTWHCGSE
jgi:hypothetical protein